MTNDTILRWEIGGIPFIFFTGAMLHFIYAWSAFWPPLVWLAAVNESMWEHFKLAFWPAVAYALIQYLRAGKLLSNFWPAKAAGLVIMPVIIAVLFYGYKAVLGRHLLLLDAVIFLVGVWAGQMVSYRILTAPRAPPVVQTLGLAVFVILVTAFLIFSYMPPHHFLFQDPATSQYGILERH